MYKVDPERENNALWVSHIPATKLYVCVSHPSISVVERVQISCPVVPFSMSIAPESSISVGAVLLVYVHDPGEATQLLTQSDGLSLSVEFVLHKLVHAIAEPSIVQVT